MDTIRQTESVCPHCLATLPATVYEKSNEVWMRKTCPDHGQFDVYLWPDAQHYDWFCGFDFPKAARAPQVETAKGCPHDCGLCPGHKRKITLPEIEVVWRCNLACPVCFMADGCAPADPSLEELRGMVQTIRRYDGPEFPLQITGGEPTVRSDLPDVIAMARQEGACAIELNTNGIAIGNSRAYLRELKEAGVTNVYLQFDGLDPAVTQKLRGADVLPVKMRAIENCRAEGIPVILSVTVVAGINDTELGALIRFAMDNLDVIGGLALQPAFVSGRFDVPQQKHLSVGDVLRLIGDQTQQQVKPRDFLPVGSSHPLCYASTYLFETEAGYDPFTKHLTEVDYRQLIDYSSPQGAVFADIVAQLSATNPMSRGLPILIMEYMDAWTMDLDRARECNLAVTVPGGASIPFCIYHLTDSRGKRLYPHGGKRVSLA